MEPNSDKPRRAETRSAHGEGALAFGRTIPQLDSLRGMACVMVLVAHLRSLPGMQAVPQVLGVAGVGIFFALSGFLITRNLIHGDRRLATFYNRRAARILPAYFLLVLVLLVVWPGWPLLWVATFCFNWLYRSGSREYFHVDAAETPIPPVGHTWSLCVEEHFYWMWPPLVVWLRPKWAGRVAGLVVIASPFVAYWMVMELVNRDFRWEEIDGLLQRITLTQLTAIAMGCWIAVHESSLARKVQLGSSAVPKLALWMLPLVIIPGLAYVTSTNTLSPLEMALGPSVLHWFCCGVFGLGLCCQWLGGLAWLRWIGRISYGLYLYHLPCYAWMGLAQADAHPSWLHGAAAVGLTFAAAIVSYRGMELPAMRWAKGKRADGTGADGQPTERTGRWGLAIAVTLAVACIATVMSADSKSRRTFDALANVTPEIPEHLRREVLRPTGAAVSAYRWMGVVHSVDRYGFRRNTPIPPRRPGVRRIAVIGDSYTWGACVEEEQTYAAELERQLQDAGQAWEVINCGKAGGEAAGLSLILRDEVIPLVAPDLVIYGVTASDIQSPTVGYGQLPSRWRQDEAVAEFQANVQRMLRTCDQAQVEMIGFAFTQKPDQADQREMTLRIQAACADAGLTMAPVDDYLATHTDANFEVSVWDRHPTAECHAIHGRLLATFLEHFFSSLY